MKLNNVAPIKCSCGHHSCTTYGLNIGSFHQGEGFSGLDQARKYAAAEDVYEALKWLLHLHHDIGRSGAPSDEWQEALEFGKLAIEKAEKGLT